MSQITISLEKGYFKVGMTHFETSPKTLPDLIPAHTDIHKQYTSWICRHSGHLNPNNSLPVCQTGANHPIPYALS